MSDVSANVGQSVSHVAPRYNRSPVHAVVTRNEFSGDFHHVSLTIFPPGEAPRPLGHVPHQSEYVENPTDPDDGYWIAADQTSSDVSASTTAES